MSITKSYLKDNAYKIVKRIVQYVIPGAGTFYFTISGIWGLPYGEQILGTMMALETSLCVSLGISSNNYLKEQRRKGGE